MATVDKFMPYPKNMFDAINRSMDGWGVTEKQFEEFMSDLPAWAHITSREKEIIEVRYKTYHTSSKAGALIHPPISGSCFCHIENRLLRKLRHYARKYVLQCEKEKPLNWSEDKFEGKMSSQLFLGILMLSGGGRITDDLAHDLGMKSARSIWNKLHRDCIDVYTIMRLAHLKGVEIRLDKNGNHKYINTAVFSGKEDSNDNTGT